MVPPTTRELRAARAVEGAWILDQLARLEKELASERSSDPPPRPVPTPVHRTPVRAPPLAPSVVADPPRFGAYSPYLEERLSASRRAVLGLARELREVAERSRTLEQSLQSIERELDRAAQEAAFVRADAELPELGGEEPGSEGIAGRGEDFLEEDVVEITAPVPPLRRTPADLRAEAASLEAGRYGEFTVARYNRTMGDLQARRRTVARGVLVAATAISLVLVTLALLAHEPQPPLWLAVLPVIWLVPVPFFVLSFRGTHRVLRRTRFDLPEGR
ncbi:MAG TPA: hypothetical protein VIZ68_04095 [Thermoplasmata archaeon]